MKHAQVLSEASTVARALEIILQRANCDVTGCSQLIQEIVRQEKSELQRSYGHIEPRSRFKTKTPRAILAERPRNVLHIDEGGQSNPEQLTPPRPTYFSLAAIAIAEEKIDDYNAAADEIKLNFFKRTDITFHEPNMRYRKDWFSFGDDAVRQKEFDSAIDNLLETTDFQVFGVGVRKEAFQREFVDAGLDPYLPTDVYALAITLLLERYLDFLSCQSTPRLASVIFESQGYAGRCDPSTRIRQDACSWLAMGSW